MVQERDEHYDEGVVGLEALRERESFVRAVLDNLPIGIAVNSVSPAVQFVYMNDNFPRIYRTTRERLSDAGAFWDVVYEDPAFREQLRNRVVADCASGDTGKMHWTDVPISRQGKQVAWIAAQNIPIPGRPMMISTVWDITALKTSEEKLRRQLDELQRWHDATIGREERMAELKQEVNELLARLGEKPRYGVG
jgi:PAS domain S-box-containing protein